MGGKFEVGKSNAIKAAFNAATDASRDDYVPGPAPGKPSAAEVEKYRNDPTVRSPEQILRALQGPGQ